MNKTQNINCTLPLQNRSLNMLPKSVDKDACTIDFLFSSGAEGKRFDFGSWEYYIEELEISDRAVDLSRFLNNASFLKSHVNHPDEVLGVVRDAWLEGDEAFCRVEFDKEDEQSMKYFSKYSRGILNKVSVGYSVQEYVETTRENDKFKRLTATKWKPTELSSVAIGFDDTAQSRSSDRNSYECLLKREVINKKGELKMENEETTVTEPVKSDKDKLNREVIEEQIRSEERERCLAIEKCINRAGLDSSMAREFIESKISIDKVRELVLDKLASENESDEIFTRSQTQSPVIDITFDEVDKKRACISDALLSRVDDSVDLTKGASHFANMSLLRICEELVPGGRNMPPSELALRALSTSDLAHIASSTAGKSLHKGYNLYERTFLPFVSIGELNNYNSVDRTKVGYGDGLEEVLEGEDYKEGKISDEKESAKLVKHGKIYSLTEEMILADDIQAFLKLFLRVGTLAARKENEKVYGLLNSNAAMSDDTALFHADHKNIASGSVINNTSLDAMRKLGRDQTFGAEKLNVKFEYLVVGSNYEGDARRYMNGDIVATKNADVSTHKGSMMPIVDPNISGNKWFAIANPLVQDTIEVSYLKGVQGPLLTEIANPRNDSIDFKVKHPVAVTALDWRGMGYNPGA